MRTEIDPKLQKIIEDGTAGYVTVYDVKNDKIIATVEGDYECYPASITKVLTAITAFKYVDASFEMVVGDEQDVMHYSPDPSVAGIEKGEKWVLKDLLYGLMLPSGNDCAYTIGYNIVSQMDEYKNLSVEGKCHAYAKLMNEYARSLGCLQTEYYTLDGNDHVKGKVARHVTSTNDLVIMLKKALEIPEIKEAMSTEYKEITIGDKVYKLKNTNRLIRKDSEFYNPNVVCGKTGTTNLAGYCLATYAKCDDKEYIVAMCHADRGPARFVEQNKIYNYLFK